MKAIKENKVYTVDEATKAEYLAKGYDIFDDGGRLIERSPSSTVSRREYDELLERYNSLRASVGDGAPADTGRSKREKKDVPES